MPDTKVKIEKSGVKSALGVASKEYVEMISNLTIANNTMLELRTYWGGNLYNDIVTKWNRIYVILNEFIKNAGTAYNFMSDALKAYTTADLEAINAGKVPIPKLKGMEEKEADTLDASTSKLRADGNTIYTKLGIAQDRLEKVFSKIVNAPASSGAINEAKNNMKLSKKTIVEGLKDVSNTVKTNITTAADRIDGAEGAVKEAVK